MADTDTQPVQQTTQNIDLFQLIDESQLKSLGLPLPVLGKQIQNLSRERGMTTTEISHMIGLNNAAIYQMQGRNTQLNASPSILLRCYAALPGFAQPPTLPSNDELVAAIQQIDPSFQKKHVAPLLGLRVNGNHRLKNNFDAASQTVKNLVYVVWTAIEQDPNNWWAIKACVEIEAESRGVQPGSQIWEHPTWGGNPAPAKNTRKPKSRRNPR